MRGNGGQIKSLGPAIGSCFKKHMSSGNTTQRRFALIFKLDQEIESALEDYAPVHGFYAVPAVEAQAARKKQMELSQLLVQLEAHSAEEDTLCSMWYRSSTQLPVFWTMQGVCTRS